MSESNSIYHCKNCGKRYHPQTSNLRRGRGLYCSRGCGNTYRTIPLEIRFRRKIGPRTESGCLPWVGNKHSFGYGQIWDRTRALFPLSAHRLAWEFAYGPIPKGMHVLHRCDNPHCVNPDHLFLGTNLDNIADKTAKGRAKGPQTSRGRRDSPGTNPGGCTRTLRSPAASPPLRPRRTPNSSRA